MEKKYKYAILGQIVGMLLNLVACNDGSISLEELIDPSRFFLALPFAFFGFIGGSLIDKK